MTEGHTHTSKELVHGEIDTQHIHTYTCIKKVQSTIHESISYTHIHPNATHIQNTHMSAYTKTQTHSWINTLGHNPREEPYGTSIGSSITQSQIYGRVTQGVSVCDKVLVLCVWHVSSYLKVMNTFPRSTMCMAWSHWNCVSSWCAWVWLCVCVSILRSIAIDYRKRQCVCVWVCVSLCQRLICSCLKGYE